MNTAIKHLSIKRPWVLFLALTLLMVNLIPCYSFGSSDAEPWPDPNTKRIASVIGTTDETAAKENFPNADHHVFSSYPDILTALKSGRVDYASCTLIESNGFALADPQVIITHRQLSASPNCIAVSKDFPEIRDQLSASIEKLSKNGTIQELDQRWYERTSAEYQFEEIPVHSEGPVLRVALDNKSAPYSFIHNGELVGHEVDLIKLLAYDMGMQVEFITMEFGALLASVQSNRAHVAICGIVYTEERAQAVDFTIPYGEEEIVLIAFVPEESSTSFFHNLKDNFEKTFLRESRWKLILEGLWVTVIITAGSAVLGTLLGFGVCLLRRSHSKLAVAFSKGFINLIQGTPLLVFLMILYYIVFAKTSLNGIQVSILAFGINFAAYAAEIFRTGIDAVDRGQWEAAEAMGFSKKESFIKIILPQAAGHFLPVLRGEFISLLKGTSIVGYVSVEDLTRVGDIIRSLTYEAFFPLISTAVIYFTLSWGLAFLLQKAERRITKHKHR